MELTKEELAQYLGTTVQQIKKNFPKISNRALNKGILIERKKINNYTIYSIKEITPQKIDYIPNNTRTIKWTGNLENEEWVDVYNNDKFEVSNQGRVRNKKTLQLHKISDAGKGYKKVSINNQNYLLHRLVLASFNPIEKWELYDVDHKDGNRANNKLENLQWATQEENILFMLNNRKELNKELTRILQNHSYDEVLEILRKIV